MKRWFLPAAARARGQSNDLDREILASNLFNCRKEVINAPPVPSISRCIHIVYRHKTVWEYQWSNFIYNCMSTFLHCLLQRCPPQLQRPWWWMVRITNRGWWNYLNQCWLLISEFLWHSPENNFTMSGQTLFCIISLKTILSKILLHLPGATELTQLPLVPYICISESGQHWFG